MSDLTWRRGSDNEEPAEEPAGEEPAIEEEEDVGRAAWRLLPLVLLLGLSVFVFVFFFMTKAPTVPQSIPTVALETPSTSLKVYVVGEVRRPGVVTLQGDSRVEDAIKAAGGFTEKANLAGVNLAARVNDADMVRVPALGEPTAEKTPRATLTPAPVSVDPPVQPDPEPVPDSGPLTPPPPPLFANETPEPVTVTATPSPVTAATPSETPTPEVPATPPPPAARVSLNRATIEQFIQVPGVTEEMASAIVAYRRGPPPRAFTTLEEVALVPGFKGVKLDAILPYLKL